VRVTSDCFRKIGSSPVTSITCILSRMRSFAYATTLVASAFLLEGSSAIEASHDLPNVLAELLLANNPANAFRAQPSTSRHVDPTMIKASRRAPAAQRPRAKKIPVYEAIIEATRKSIEGADIIFALPSTGLTVVQRDMLKTKLPEDVLATVVKNSLMKRAIEDSEAFKPVEPLLKGANMWFFLKFEDLRDTVKVIDAWRKEEKMEKGSYEILGGAMDGEFHDNAGIVALSKLPTKQELMGKVAFLIKQIPTKLAKGIKEVPTGLARGVKAVSEKEEESA